MEKRTIFLVDDDKTNLNVGRNVLAETYNVFTLNSGSRLLKMLEKLIPDLILLDVNMPEMDGYETIQHLKANAATANIPVIFLTSLSEEALELKGLTLGAIDYITKPFSPLLLLKRIEVHLLVESQKRELINYTNNLEQMVTEKTKAVVELKNAVLEILAELLEDRDEITGGHIDRTTQYIKELLRAMKKSDIYTKELSNYDEALIVQSSQLHDVGKISIKDSILFKPEKLTNEEFEVIKAHTVFGEKIINRIKAKTSDSEFLEYARIFTVTHHEKWDGSGYPHGLEGEDIPLLGRLMAIADVYDALVSERPYKSAFPHSKAVDIIQEGKGTHFDPVLVDLMTEVSAEFAKIADTHKGNLS